MLCTGLSGDAAVIWTMEFKVVYFNFLTAWWEGHSGTLLGCLGFTDQAERPKHPLAHLWPPLLSQACEQHASA